MTLTVGLIANAQDHSLIKYLQHHFTISGVYLQGDDDANITAFPIIKDIASLLKTNPKLCCFLSPYQGLEDDLRRCLENGSHVLGAGPLFTSTTQYKHIQALAQKNGLHLQWNPMHIHSARHQTLLTQSRRSAFGTPVYLRQIRGNGHSLLAAWWATTALYDAAVDLLGTPSRLLVNAHTAANGYYQVVITLQTINEANAQLIVSPTSIPGEGHLSFLGSGAMLSDADPFATQTLISNDTFLPAPDFPVHQAWLTNFIAQLSNPPKTYPDICQLEVYHRFLFAIEQAQTQHQAIDLALT